MLRQRDNFRFLGLGTPPDRRRVGSVGKKMITLTKKEHDRLVIIRRVTKRELKQKDAAELLEL